MTEVFCPDCRFKQPSEHHFCFRCGRALPRHLFDRNQSKLARFFAGVRIDQADPENAYLRVSSTGSGSALAGPFWRLPR